ncbi:hypothetical protein HOK51_05545 [Candidatus Woesearchaeota archaeon]|nr:hypothetical protein [Candidatus Woesearchaeota archaeon]MBT6519292.1 hypothetical protein [Candidatus Woesearchaeota archaeon]
MNARKNKQRFKDLELSVTLWPTFPHFEQFALDKRLSAIRLNSAMVGGDRLDNELTLAKKLQGAVPMYFDLKGRQLRIREVNADKSNLELTLNHPIEVKTPVEVLFKAGEDYAVLDRVVDGKHLIFDGGPEFMVYEGESLHIRDPSLNVTGPIFLDYEIEKIEKSMKAGFDKYFLSFVESQRDIDEFRELVGDSHIYAKIESKAGLRYVQNEFRRSDNLNLMAARGDMYVEVDKPHDILNAMKLIINKDPDAGVGSRMLLSVMDKPVPSCADLSELAWLYDIGYRKMMLCDELCLKGDLLGTAVNVFESFRNSYARRPAPYLLPESKQRSGYSGSVSTEFGPDEPGTAQSWLRRFGFSK